MPIYSRFCRNASIYWHISCYLCKKATYCIAAMLHLSIAAFKYCCRVQSTMWYLWVCLLRQFALKSKPNISCFQIWCNSEEVADIGIQCRLCCVKAALIRCIAFGCRAADCGCQHDDRTYSFDCVCWLCASHAVHDFDCSFCLGPKSCVIFLVFFLKQPCNQ